MASCTSAAPRRLRRVQSTVVDIRQQSCPQMSTMLSTFVSNQNAKATFNCRGRHEARPLQRMPATIPLCLVSQRRKGHTRLQGPCLVPALTLPTGPQQATARLWGHALGAIGSPPPFLGGVEGGFWVGGSFDRMFNMVYPKISSHPTNPVHFSF